VVADFGDAVAVNVVCRECKTVLTLSLKEPSTYQLTALIVGWIGMRPCMGNGDGRLMD
jgi:hypothetical protein